MFKATRLQGFVDEGARTTGVASKMNDDFSYYLCFALLLYFYLEGRQSEIEPYDTVKKATPKDLEKQKNQ